MPTAWDAPGAEEAAKKKTKRKKGTWQNHAERYTEAKMDEAPIYMTKLGKESIPSLPTRDPGGIAQAGDSPPGKRRLTANGVRHDGRVGLQPSAYRDV